MKNNIKNKVDYILDNITSDNRIHSNNSNKKYYYIKYGAGKVFNQVV